MAPSLVTIDQVAHWLGLNQRTDPINDMLDGCLNAVVSYFVTRLGDWVPEPWPAHVEQCVVMQTAREFKRRNSPEGAIGFGDMGVIRVTSLDPDVEALLNNDLAWHFA